MSALFPEPIVEIKLTRKEIAARLSIKRGWTPERLQKLRDLWSAGLSASEIAAEIGGITRNSVIGKAWRLGLEARSWTSSRAPGYMRDLAVERIKNKERCKKRRAEARAEREADKSRKPQMIYVEPDIEMRPYAPIIELMRRVSIWDLTDTTCRWPLGEPRDLTYCGATPISSTPYCADHYKRSLARYAHD